MSHKGNRPGWYPNPDGPGQRWWNGLTWSDAFRTDSGRPMTPAAAGVTGPVVHRPRVHRQQRPGLAGTLVLLLLIGLSLALAMVFWTMRDGLAVPDGYMTTTGVVSRVEMRDTTCHDVVTYEVAGQEYQAVDSVGAPNCTPLGMGVDVAFDPADPAQSRIPHPLGVTILTVLAALPLLAAVLLGLLLLRRLRRDETGGAGTSASTSWPPASARTDRRPITRGPGGATR